MKITKKRLVIYAFLLAVVWAYAITTLSVSIEEIPYYIQFALVSGVAYVFPSVILGQAFLNSTYKKIFGTWLFLLSVDLIIPPLVIGLDGIYTPVMLGTASPDYFFAQIYGSFGLTGPVLFFMVYPVTFVVLVFISTRILSNRQLTELT